MKLDIITAEEAYKLTENKQSGVPSEIIEEVMQKVVRAIKVAAAYEGLTELTFDVGRLFFTDTGVIFSDDDEHKAAREVSKTLREAGYKVLFEHTGPFELNPEDFDYRERMTVTWRK